MDHNKFESFLLIFKPLTDFFFRIVFKKNMSDETYLQMTKHVMVGGFSAILNYGLFITLIYMKFSIVAANTITMTVIGILYFFSQKHFTYKVKSYNHKQFLYFFINITAYYLLDTSIIKLFSVYLKLDPRIGKIISMIILLPTSFFFQKYIVFKATNKQEK